MINFSDLARLHVSFLFEHLKRFHWICAVAAYNCYVPVLNVKLACVAWRFCRAGRRSGVAAKFAREARENERRSREKNKNRLPGFVAFSTAAPFNSFWHPVNNLFGFSFPSQSEIKCWQPNHDTKARDIFQVASAPISSRFLCPRPPLLLSAPNQNRHATQANVKCEMYFKKYFAFVTSDLSFVARRKVSCFWWVKRRGYSYWSMCTGSEGDT